MQRSVAVHSSQTTSSDVALLRVTRCSSLLEINSLPYISSSSKQGAALQGSMSRLAVVALAAALRGTALEPVARRTILKTVPAAAAIAAPAQAATEDALKKTSCFEVIPDSSLALKPKLTPINPDKCIGGLKAAKALYLGEHHNSLRDHLLQADILTALRRSEPRRPMAVGLEAI